MSWDWLAWLADALVLASLVVMTVGVYGLFRLRDVHTQLHAASKTVVLGVVALVVASVATRDAGIIGRALLLGAFLVVATPVAAHVVARAAYRAEADEEEAPG